MKIRLAEIYTKLIGFGAIGLAASFILTLEKIELLKNPSHVPSCSINPLFSCSNIIGSPEAAAFGFPNPLIGIISFSVVITIGFALLAGARFKPWFWQGLQAGVVFGISFVHWLMYVSFFNVRALCLYCMIAWTAMIPLFVFVTAHNLKNGYIKMNHGKRLGSWLSEHGLKITVSWYLVIALIIFVNFWDFWRTIFI